MKTNLYKITLILLVLFLSIGAFAQKKLLYVGTNSKPTCDTVITAALEDKEYEVTWITTATYSTDFPDAAAYAAYDVIMFSESIGSTDGRPFKVAGFPIPCVNLEGWSVKMDRWDFMPTDMEATDFLQAGDAAVDDGVLTLIIEEVDHWIANQYEPDYELVWSTSLLTDGVCGFKLDPYVDGAIEIGYYNVDIFAELPSIWAIPEGSVILGDNTVFESNVVLIGSIMDGMSEPTEEFIDFLVICIQWATGDFAASVNDMQSNNLNVYPNPTNGIVNVSHTSPVSENVRVNIYDIAGRLMKTINSDDLSAGNNTINFDISGLAEAQYIYEIITKNDILRGKICKTK